MASLSSRDPTAMDGEPWPSSGDGWTSTETTHWSVENTTVEGNRSSAQCQLTNSNIWFTILSGLFVLVGVPGVIGNVVLMFLLPKAPLLHKNVRYMMVNMTSAALFLCVWCGGRGVFNLLLVLGVTSLSERISPVKCALIECVATTSALLLIISIFGMGAERLYATWKRETSDQRSEWLTKLIIGLWATAAFNTFIQLVTSSREPSLCYCHSALSFHSAVLLLTCVGYFCIEIPALIIYFVVRRWNKRRLLSFGVNKAATHSLSERFQIWNTLRATEMLLTSVIVHGLCYTVVQLGSYPAYLFYFNRSTGTDVDVVSLNLLHTVMFFMVFHAAAHPYISIWCSDHLRKLLKRHIESVWGKKRTKVNTATGAAVGEVGQKTMVLNSRPDAEANGFFEHVQTVGIALEDRPQFARPRVAAKAGQRMGIPAKQRSAPRENIPAYQVYQISPEQSAALLQRFWR